MSNEWAGRASWALLVPPGLWAALRWSGWVPGFRWEQLIAFTPYVAAAAIVPVVIAGLLRRRAAAFAGVVIVVALAAAVVPRALPDGDPGARGPGLRVLAANLKVGAADPAEVASLVRRLRPDVLAVQELTPEAAAGLDRAGLKRLLPHRVLRPLPGVGGSGVYARHPASPAGFIEFGGFGQARARVAVPGAPVEVVSVHPCAPSEPDLAACWRAGLRALPGAGRDVVRVLAGDFNATLDHAALRRVIGAGYRDAADAAGAGLRTTWPYGGARFAPRVTLDHVLADRRASVGGFGAYRISGTDHRAVRADLRLPVSRR